MIHEFARCGGGGVCTLTTKLSAATAHREAPAHSFHSQHRLTRDFVSPTPAALPHPTQLSEKYMHVYNASMRMRECNTPLRTFSSMCYIKRHDEGSRIDHIISFSYIYAYMRLRARRNAWGFTPLSHHLLI